MKLRRYDSNQRYDLFHAWSFYSMFHVINRAFTVVKTFSVGENIIGDMQCLVGTYLSSKETIDHSTVASDRLIFSVNVMCQRL